MRLRCMVLLVKECVGKDLIKMAIIAPLAVIALLLTGSGTAFAQSAASEQYLPNSASSPPTSEGASVASGAPGSSSTSSSASPGFANSSSSSSTSGSASSSPVSASSSYSSSSSLSTGGAEGSPATQPLYADCSSSSDIFVQLMCPPDQSVASQPSSSECSVSSDIWVQALCRIQQENPLQVCNSNNLDEIEQVGCFVNKFPRQPSPPGSIEELLSESLLRGVMATKAYQLGCVNALNFRHDTFDSPVTRSDYEQCGPGMDVYYPPGQ